MPAHPEPRTYHQHRERQRRRILDAAAGLFDERGIDRVALSDITSSAGVRASTTYQYFANKDEIIWALFERMLESSVARMRDATRTAETTIEKITALLECMADDLTNDRATVRFMAQFDAMYARDLSPERLLAIEAQVSPHGIEYLGTLIREGVADGSLRADLDPEVSMHAVMNAVIGTQRRLASLGRRVEIEYGRSIDAMFLETIRIILAGLRAR